jgi:hypothetical protein
MTGNRFLGLVALGTFAATILSGPARAQEAAAVHQTHATASLADAQTAREAVTHDKQLSFRQQHLLAKADLELQRANEYYQSGRYRDAARVADHATALLTKASLPGRHDLSREVK